uniref:Uncharacterized protein n=1 Tax=Bicosoecida sp. CB-2014 TaxID=1486930 RepID=A0A7S1G737_9STRA
MATPSPPDSMRPALRRPARQAPAPVSPTVLRKLSEHPAADAHAGARSDARMGTDEGGAGESKGVEDAEAPMRRGAAADDGDADVSTASAMAQHQRLEERARAEGMSALLSRQLRETRATREELMSSFEALFGGKAAGADAAVPAV